MIKTNKHSINGMSIYEPIPSDWVEPTEKPKMDMSDEIVHRIVTEIFESKKITNEEKVTMMLVLPVLETSDKNYNLMDRILEIAIEDDDAELVEAILNISAKNFRPKEANHYVTTHLAKRKAGEVFKARYPQEFRYYTAATPKV
ncbi:MAG: hypothetical protein WCF19_03265 [Chlamydiales bacterium]